MPGEKHRVHRPSVGCRPWSPTSSACGCPTVPARWARSRAGSEPSAERSWASRSSSGARAERSTSSSSTCPEPALKALLVQEIQQVDGVDVEEMRPVTDALHDPRLDALETAAILVGATERDELTRAVVVHARRAVGAEWSAVVALDDGAVVAEEGPAPQRAGWSPSSREAARRPGWRPAKSDPTTSSGRRCPSAGLGARGRSRRHGLSGPGAPPGGGAGPHRRHPAPGDHPVHESAPTTRP